MKRISRSETTYIVIVLVMLLGKALWSYFKLDDPLVQRFVNSWTMMLIIAVLGFLCVRLSPTVGFPNIWDDTVSQRKRILLPMVCGIGFAVLQIILVTLQHMNVPMVPFPLSIPVYISVGILSELVFHFVPLVLLLWLISIVIFRKRWQTQIFWVIALILSLWEPVLQLVMMVKMNMLPNIFAGILPFLLVFAANIIPLYFIKKYGFLSAIVWRLSDYVIWHIIWGGFAA